MKIYEKLANTYVILLLFGVFLVFILYLFPSYQKEISDSINHKFNSFDGRFTYTKSDVMSTLKEIGIEGRKKYAFISGVIDMVYPFIYSLLFSLLLYKLTRRINHSKFVFVSCLPFIAAIFDYAENFSVLKMINDYDKILNAQVQFSSFCTSAKWILIAISLLLTMGLSVYHLIKGRR